jgi:hypothetical protein
MAISGFLLLLHLYGWGPLLSITGDIIHPITMGRIIMGLLDIGSLATGRIGGLPMGWRGPGFQAIGNMPLNDQKAPLEKTTFCPSQEEEMMDSIDNTASTNAGAF